MRREIQRGWEPNTGALRWQLGIKVCPRYASCNVVRQKLHLKAREASHLLLCASPSSLRSRPASANLLLTLPPPLSFPSPAPPSLPLLPLAPAPAPAQLPELELPRKIRLLVRDAGASSIAIRRNISLSPAPRAADGRLPRARPGRQPGQLSIHPLPAQQARLDAEARLRVQVGELVARAEARELGFPGSTFSIVCRWSGNGNGGIGWILWCIVSGVARLRCFGCARMCCESFSCADAGKQDMATEPIELS